MNRDNFVAPTLRKHVNNACQVDRKILGRVSSSKWVWKPFTRLDATFPEGLL
jgi:hypothetical protein